MSYELGVTMGPDATSRTNGSVGGEITKRLVKIGEQHLGSTSNYQANTYDNLTVSVLSFFMLSC